MFVGEMEAMPPPEERYSFDGFWENPLNSPCDPPCAMPGKPGLTPSPFHPELPLPFSTLPAELPLCAVPDDCSPSACNHFVLQADATRRMIPKTATRLDFLTLTSMVSPIPVVE